MIFVGIGANLPSERFETPMDTCIAALAALPAEGVEILRRSRWYESAPVPASDQPWYVNGVAQVQTAMSPVELLSALHRVEQAFGRSRRRRNEARVLDLDLLAYGNRIEESPEGLKIPHPRMHERAFVLVPLAEIAPEWVHPILDRSVADLISALPDAGAARPIS